MKMFIRLCQVSTVVVGLGGLLGGCNTTGGFENRPQISSVPLPDGSEFVAVNFEKGNFLTAAQTVTNFQCAPTRYEQPVEALGPPPMPPMRRFNPHHRVHDLKDEGSPPPMPMPVAVRGGCQVVSGAGAVHQGLAGQFLGPVVATAGGATVGGLLNIQAARAIRPSTFSVTNTASAPTNVQGSRANAASSSSSAASSSSTSTTVGAPVSVVSAPVNINRSDNFNNLTPTSIQTVGVQQYPPPGY